MARSFALACVVTAAAAGLFFPAPADGQNASPLAGVWTLNRSLSEFPREIGFNADWISAAGGDSQDAGANTGRGGRRGASGAGGRAPAGSFPVRRESYEDARRVQLLTADVRNPAIRLMIVDTPATFTITNELGQSRTLHPNGKEESIDLEGVPIPVTTTRDGDRVVVLYRAEKDREVRYTYSHSANPSQLVVEVQFLEHGTGDKAKRVYEPGIAPATLSSAGAATAPASSSQQAQDAFDQRPGAELKGLKNLGILVEDLSAPAVACGLNHDAIESALSKRLTDGGFEVRRNSDDESYVYVNIMTMSLANGTCVSRYDAFLYTHATAKVSYHDRPVLVQISLAHRGGIGSSASTAHAAAVGRGLESFVDLFITQIHDANK
jgi:hypothetical protein